MLNVKCQMLIVKCQMSYVQFRKPNDGQVGKKFPHYPVSLMRAVWFFLQESILNMNISNRIDVSRGTQFLLFHFLSTGALLHRLYPFHLSAPQQPAQNNLRLALAKVNGTNVVVGHNACPQDDHRVAYSEAHVQPNVQYLQFTCLTWICDFSQVWNKWLCCMYLAFSWALLEVLKEKQKL